MSRVVLWSVFAAFLLTVVGCRENQYTVRRSDAAAALVGEKLPPGSSFYVAVPKDGSYDGTIYYRGSGQMTADLLAAALRPYAFRVETAMGPVEYDYLLSRAQEGGFTYLIYPTIINWENRASTWTAQDDKVNVRVDIINAKTGQRLDSATLEGAGLKWVREPQDLLKPLANDWAAGLF